MKELSGELITNGFVVIPDVISSSACDQYVKMLNRDFKKFSEGYKNSSSKKHGLNDKYGEKFVYNLHNKDIKYFDLFDNYNILNLVEAVLKDGSYENSEPVNILNMSARCPAPFSNEQQLHIDSNLPGRNGFPLIVVALIMLDDFTEVNGSTRVVPGSHQFEGYAENKKKYDNEVKLTGKKGSVAIFNGALWHGSSLKMDNSSRWGVIISYGRWFIKPSFDFSKNIPANIYNSLSIKRLRLLGLDSAPPKDEFTRSTRRSVDPEWCAGYKLPE